MIGWLKKKLTENKKREAQQERRISDLEETVRRLEFDLHHLKLGTTLVRSVPYCRPVQYPVGAVVERLLDHCGLALQTLPATSSRIVLAPKEAPTVSVKE